MDQFLPHTGARFHGVPGKTDEIEGRKWTGADAYYLRALVESSYEGIGAVDMEGRFTAWNQGLELIFGYTAEEVLGQSVALTAPLERKGEFVGNLGRLKSGQTHNRYETVRKRKDGSHVDIAMTISPIYDDEGVMIGSSTMIHDLTDFRRVEAALRESEKRKDIFISMASHELKTPITSIKAFTQILAKMFAAEGNTTATQYLARMEMQINKLNKLVADLLDISRMQAEKLEFTQEPFDFDAMVRDVVQDVETTSARHQIMVSGEAHTELLGDRDRIGQVLTNLLTNAVKFSPDAETVQVTVTADKSNATVSVQDYGVGIPEEHQERIFERFYRVYSEKDQMFPGLGIGLYISAEIVKQHGGRMWFESVEGAGSTFSFSLPVRKEK